MAGAGLTGAGLAGVGLVMTGLSGVGLARLWGLVGSSGYTPRLGPVGADNGVGCSGRYRVDADIGGNALHEVRSCQWRLQVVNTALTHGVVTPGIELVVWGGNVGVRGV